MSGLLSHISSLLRSFAQVTGVNSSSGSLSKKVRLCLLTAVAGYDNKRTKYQTRISQKWVYGDDACFLSKTKSTYFVGKLFVINKYLIF